VEDSKMIKGRGKEMEGGKKMEKGEWKRTKRRK
jgi:hypothetical protein